MDAGRATVCATRHGHSVPAVTTQVPCHDGAVEKPTAHFIISAPDVLHQRMAGDEHLGVAVSLNSRIGRRGAVALRQARAG
jgi:hypothetical protein